ncbi:YceI family protein [Chitinophaga sp. CF418]|uniref:YceI family protein n=1 Tax=Chitinophaga sp. CF418 TaxID=1855287 RepID=UPI0009242997|nr:YceI family protein [Chitinophaga sp. CF418]SHN03050.1 YceI-like domain-containing protein [Chitinophaga sp. CF418]
MKRYILLSAMLLLTATVFSQERFFTKNGHISFEAGTDLEDIKAVNNGASSVFDTSTGQIECAVLIKGFEFRRALMQEHFNENYMESDKYPKAIFKGKIINIDKVNFRQDGTYPLKIKGLLEMHGTKKEIETNGILNIAGEVVNAHTEFTVLISDYNISIPGLVKDKISKTATVKIECIYNALK